MSVRTGSQTVPVASLAKGYNSYANPLEQPEGTFPDGTNLDFRNMAPHTIDGVQILVPTPPDGGNVIWADSFNISQFLGGNPSQPNQTIPAQNRVIFATDLGNLYAYDLTSLTFVPLRSGLAKTPRFYTACRFRQLMVLTNGIDPPLKYDGAASYPIASEPIARFEASEAWVLASGTGTVSADTVNVREGAQAIQLTAAGAGTISMAWTPPTALDLLTGIAGAPSFAAADVVRFQIYVPDSSLIAPVGTVFTEGTQPYSVAFNILKGTAQGNYTTAQKFTVGGSPITVGSAQIAMHKVGSPTNQVQLQIQTDNAGLPSNTAVTNGTSQTVNLSALPTSSGFVTFTFSNPVALSASTSYWLVFVAVGSPNLDGVNYGTADGNNATGAGNAQNTSAAPTTWTAVAAAGFIFNLLGTSTNAQIVFTTSTGNTFTGSLPGPFATGWNSVAIPQSSFAIAGSPIWSSITKITFQMVTSKAGSITLDDLLMAYNLSPPPSQVCAVFNGSLLLGDTPGDRLLVNYSDINLIDSFPVQFFFRVVGGTSSLEDIDHVSALKIYAGICVVGKPNAIFSLSGAAGNFTLSPFSTEIGIDSHRGIIESPRGLFFPHDNLILALRLTSKEVLSQAVTPLLAQLDHNNADQTIGVRNDNTHTLRWSFRRQGQTKNDLVISYDYFLNAWWPPETIHPGVHFFSVNPPGTGARKIGVANGEPHIAVFDSNDPVTGANTVEGGPLPSSITLPFKSRPAQSPMDLPLATRWVGFTGYLAGTAGGTTVQVFARGVNHAYEIATTPFTLMGNLQTNPSGDAEAWVDFPNGIIARYIQVKLVSASGQFELKTPCFYHFFPTTRPGL